jgi:hypothetical protein
VCAELRERECPPVDEDEARAALGVRPLEPVERLLGLATGRKQERPAKREDVAAAQPQVECEPATPELAILTFDAVQVPVGAEVTLRTRLVLAPMMLCTIGEVVVSRPDPDVPRSTTSARPSISRRS